MFFNLLTINVTPTSCTGRLILYIYLLKVSFLRFARIFIINIFLLLYF